MARPRVPLIKAQTTGRTIRNPKRRAIGEPPTWFKTPSQREAWNTFSDELPWLNKSLRALVSIASDIRGRPIAGEDVGVKALNLFRMILSQMGATPSDASKVKMPDDEQPEDPANKYFR